MRVKIFQAGGHSEINDLEDTINSWLDQSGAKVQNISTAMCQVGEAERGERYQQLTVTILYQPIN